MVLRDNEPVEAAGILLGVPVSVPVDYDVDNYQVDGEKEDENVDYVDSVSTMSVVERDTVERDTVECDAVERDVERDVERSIPRDENGREQIPCRGRRHRCCGSSSNSSSDSDSSSSDSDSSCDFDHSSHGNLESYNIHRDYDQSSDSDEELQVVGGSHDSNDSNEPADMEVVGSSLSDSSDSSGSDDSDKTLPDVYIYRKGKPVKVKVIHKSLLKHVPKPECKIKDKDAGRSEEMNVPEDVSDFNAASRNSTDHISARTSMLKSAVFPQLPVWSSEFGHGNRPSESPGGDRSLKFGQSGGFGDRPIGYSEYGKPYYSRVSDPWANVKTPFQARQLELLEIARKLSRPQY